MSVQAFAKRHFGRAKGIVADGLAETIEFCRELGLELEGQAMIEGEWAGRVTGLGDQRVEDGMMRTPAPGLSSLRRRR